MNLQSDGSEVDRLSKILQSSALCPHGLTRNSDNVPAFIKVLGAILTPVRPSTIEGGEPKATFLRCERRPP